MTWRSSYFDLASGLCVPQPATGEFTPVEGTERRP